MKRTVVVGMLAVALVVGMVGVSGVGAAEPVSTDENPVTETSSDEDADPPICWGVIHDPWGMPVYYPYPCVK